MNLLAYDIRGMVLCDVFHLYARSHIVFLRSLLLLLVTANFIPSSPILATLMTEALSSSEALGLARATRYNILEDRVLPLKFLVLYNAKITSYFISINEI
jgi:hypothetical protein